MDVMGDKATLLETGRFAQPADFVVPESASSVESVPAGNWLLDAAGAPPSPERVTVEPLQTCWPAPAFPAFPPAAFPAASSPWGS